ncbi:hypothetical protein TcG_02025 [Trypanosoma cruzi]|nr:hypothetical protein TcG_02025 [Trypanosoma cruzi]
MRLNTIVFTKRVCCRGACASAPFPRGYDEGNEVGYGKYCVTTRFVPNPANLYCKFYSRAFGGCLECLWSLCGDSNGSHSHWSGAMGLHPHNHVCMPVQQWGCCNIDVAVMRITPYIQQFFLVCPIN